MSQPGEHPVDLGDLQGAWRRDGRTLTEDPFAEDPLTEVADVLWLQVGRHFCDLRTPWAGTESTHVLDQPQAFSGTVRVSAGAISFHHDLDSLPRDPAHPDEGTVHRQADVMFERGPGFEERWVVASSPGDEVGLAELRPSNAAPQVRLIRIGAVALAVWGHPTPGGAQFTQGNGWRRERSLPDGAPRPEIDAAAQALGQGGPLPPGWITIEPGEV
jgi:hypothetical protein